jgi:hypothetical protein
MPRNAPKCYFSNFQKTAQSEQPTRLGENSPNPVTLHVGQADLKCTTAFKNATIALALFYFYVQQ